MNPVLSNTLQVLYSERKDGNVVNALTELNISILTEIRELKYRNVDDEIIKVLEQVRAAVMCIQEKALDIYKEDGETILENYFKTN